MKSNSSVYRAKGVNAKNLIFNLLFALYIIWCPSLSFATTECNEILSSRDSFYTSKAFMITEEYSKATQEIRGLYNPAALAIGEIIEIEDSKVTKVIMEVRGASPSTGSWITYGYLIAELIVVFGGSPVVSTYGFYPTN